MSGTAVCGWLAFTASVGIGAGAVRTTPRAGMDAARSPLTVRHISVHRLNGRLVGSAVISNTGNTTVRATTGVLGLGRARGVNPTGLLTFAIPSLAPGSSSTVHIRTRSIAALPVEAGTYRVLVCTDVYSQVQRFTQNANCSHGGWLAIATIRLHALTGAVPNTIIKADHASRSRSNTVFRFSSTVPRSVFECRLDGGPWLACRSPKRYTALVDGPHVFQVRAITPSGKEDPLPAHASWIVGTDRPTGIRRTVPQTGSELTGQGNDATQPSSTSSTAGSMSGTTSGTPVPPASNSSGGETLGQDDFDRADGGLGSGWVAMSDGGLSIASDMAVGSAGGLAGDIRVGESYGSDQYSQIEVSSDPLPVADWIGTMVRSQNGGQDGYLGLYWNDQITGNYELQLYERQSGSWVQLGSTYTLGGPLPAATQLTVTAVGSRISLQENGVERIAATDNSLTGGAPGIMTYGSAAIASWAGGTPDTYSIGGTVSGLSGTVVLQDNGGDDLAVSSDGPFAFSTLLEDGNAYDVTVESEPNDQTCTTSDATGSVATANVTNVTVTCTSSTTTPDIQVQYLGTDATGVASYDFTSPDDGNGTHVLRVLEPTHPAPGVPHNFLYVLPVEPELGTVYGDGLETMANLDAEDQYNLTIIEPSFAIDPWYANDPDDPAVQYETFMTKDLEPWVTQNLTPEGQDNEPFAPLADSGQNWLIGFSKSGLGAIDLLMKHPDVFGLAAAWDFPADMNNYAEYGSSSADNYGTDANFQANYRLTQGFVDAHAAPFLSQNRIWIGGYNTFQADMTDFDTLLTSEGIEHTTETPQEMAHRWDSGWVPIALSALSQDSVTVAMRFSP